MRVGESYRLNAKTLGIGPTDQPRTTHMIPKGGVVHVKAGPNTIVSIVADPLDDYRMVDVTWSGQPFMIFARDLRERGERVVGAKA